jgi:Zn-dependent protease with chaperone function
MLRMSQLFLLNFILFVSWHALAMEEDTKDPQNVFLQEMPIKGKTKNAFSAAMEMEAYLEKYSGHTIQIDRKELPILVDIVDKVLDIWGIRNVKPILLSIGDYSTKDRIVVDKNDVIIIGAYFITRYSDAEIAANISHELVHYTKEHLSILNKVYVPIVLGVGYYYAAVDLLIQGKPSLWDLFWPMYAMALTKFSYTNGIITYPPMSWLSQGFEYEADAVGFMMTKDEQDIAVGMLTYLIRDYFIHELSVDKLAPTIAENLAIIRNIESKKSRLHRTAEKLIYSLLSTHPRRASRVEEVCKLFEGTSSWPQYKQYKGLTKIHEWLVRMFCCGQDELKID